MSEAIPSHNPGSPVSSPSSSDSLLPEIDFALRNRALLVALLLAVLAGYTYWPTLDNGFVNYDDPSYVTQNAQVQQGLTWNNVAWAFRSTQEANWHPLTWISHMKDVELYHLRPTGHHATNLILHVLNTLLFFFLLFRATGYLWRAAAAAALWSVHPLQVETVAWIAERKSLLCTFFLLLTLLVYGIYGKSRKPVHYALVVVFFALGIMSKAMVVTLPFALLLVDVWPLNRLQLPQSGEPWAGFWSSLKKLSVEKIPLFAMSAASVWVTVWAQHKSGAVGSSNLLPFSWRLENAIYSFAQYLVKTVWPADLAVFYPHPEGSLAVWRVSIAGVLLLAITVFVWMQRQHKYLVVGWFFYLGTLLPVIGLIQLGRQGMADRYAYIPLLGVVISVVWLISDATKNSAALRTVAKLSCSVAVVLLAIASQNQCGVWKDSVTLFSHAREVTTNNYLAENNLGQAYMEVQRADLAFPHFRAAAAEGPTFSTGHYNLALLLQLSNHPEDATKEYGEALRYTNDPIEAAQSHNNLGVIYLQSKNFAAARREFDEALKINPAKQNSYVSRGLAEFGLKDWSAAHADFLKANDLQKSPLALYWIGRTYEETGDPASAKKAYEEAQTLAPGWEELKKRILEMSDARK